MFCLRLTAAPPLSRNFSPDPNQRQTGMLVCQAVVVGVITGRCAWNGISFGSGHAKRSSPERAEPSEIHVLTAQVRARTM